MWPSCYVRRSLVLIQGFSLDPSDFFSAELWPLDKREDFWIYPTWNKNCISRFENSVSWQFLQRTFVESIFTWKSLWMEDCKEQKFASCQSRVLFSAFLRIFLLMLRRFFDGTDLNSGQRLYNVNGTHFVLASGKQLLPKFFDCF